MLCTSGILGILISFATATQIKYTSPLTHNVSATAKAAAQTAIALLLFQNPVTGLGLASIWIVLLGSLSYSIVRRREMIQKAVQERLPEKV
jgi:GDP-fucose transporter C1